MDITSLAHGDPYSLTRPDHLRQVIDSVSGCPPRLALSRLGGYLHALSRLPALSEDHLFEMVTQLDEAAQPALRRLTEALLDSDGTKADWGIGHAFWRDVTMLYDRALEALLDGGVAAHALQKIVGRLCIRLVIAQGQRLHWGRLSGADVPPEAWESLSRAVALAENSGALGRMLPVYAATEGQSSTEAAFAHIVVAHAACAEGFSALQTCLSGDLIRCAIRDVRLSDRPTDRCAFWMDLLAPAAPQRMRQLPEAPSPGLRYLSLGVAYQTLDHWLECIEQGGELPEAVLGGRPVSPALIETTLRSIAHQCSPLAVQRAVPRHEANYRVAVWRGLKEILAVCGQSATATSAVPEVWWVNDVSAGGFGVSSSGAASDVMVGDLWLLLPDGGEEWLPALVRRVNRRMADTRVGLQVVGTGVKSVLLSPVDAEGGDPVEGMLLAPFDSDEWLLLVPPGQVEGGMLLRCTGEGLSRRVCVDRRLLRGVDHELIRCRGDAR